MTDAYVIGLPQGLDPAATRNFYNSYVKKKTQIVYYKIKTQKASLSVFSLTKILISSSVVC